MFTIQNIDMILYLIYVKTMTKPMTKNAMCAICGTNTSILRRYMAEILLIRRKTLYNQSINLSIINT